MRAYIFLSDVEIVDNSAKHIEAARMIMYDNGDLIVRFKTEWLKWLFSLDYLQTIRMYFRRMKFFNSLTRPIEESQNKIIIIKRNEYLTVFQRNMIIEISGAILQESPVNLQRRSLLYELLSAVPFEASIGAQLESSLGRLQKRNSYGLQ